MTESTIDRSQVSDSFGVPGEYPQEGNPAFDVELHIARYAEAAEYIANLRLERLKNN